MTAALKKTEEKLHGFRQSDMVEFSSMKENCQ